MSKSQQKNRVTFHQKINQEELTHILESRKVARLALTIVSQIIRFMNIVIEDDASSCLITKIC